MAKLPRRAAGRSKTARSRATSSARKPAGRTTAKRAGKAKTVKGAKKATQKKTAGARGSAGVPAGGPAAAPVRKTTASASRKTAALASRKRAAPASRKTTARKTTSAAKAIKSSRTRAVGRASAASAQRKAAPPAARPTKKPATRRVLPDDLVPTPPSTLNMDRSASAARSGRRELAQHIREHNESGPALTAGDVDATWELAYSSGDEAPGGDNPTPDQDVVEEIGRAIGIEYADNEELRASDKVADRDKHRWELDPASSDDYQERARKK